MTYSEVVKWVLITDYDWTALDAEASATGVLNKIKETKPMVFEPWKKRKFLNEVEFQIIRAR